MALTARRPSGSRRAWWSALAICLAVTEGGCASATSWRTLSAVPPDAVVLPVEGRMQEGDRCGPNALAILFAAAGRPVDEPSIANAIQHRGLNGSLNIDLLLFSRAQGFPARFETGTVEGLIKKLSNGIPPLLMMKLERASKWSFRKQRFWHYVVVYGFSRSERVFFVHSGWGRRRVGFTEIDKPLSQAGYWMMDLGHRTEERHEDQGLGARGVGGRNAVDACRSLATVGEPR